MAESLELGGAAFSPSEAASLHQPLAQPYQLPTTMTRSASDPNTAALRTTPGPPVFDARELTHTTSQPSFTSASAAPVDAGGPCGSSGAHGRSHADSAFVSRTTGGAHGSSSSTWLASGAASTCGGNGTTGLFCSFWETASALSFHPGSNATAAAATARLPVPAYPSGQARSAGTQPAVTTDSGSSYIVQQLAQTYATHPGPPV
jgi:hypothetical protein